MRIFRILIIVLLVLVTGCRTTKRVAKSDVVEIVSIAVDSVADTFAESRTQEAECKEEFLQQVETYFSEPDSAGLTYVTKTVETKRISKSVLNAESSTQKAERIESVKVESKVYGSKTEIKEKTDRKIKWSWIFLFLYAAIATVAVFWCKKRF
jgi:hypothetical protein